MAGSFTSSLVAVAASAPLTPGRTAFQQNGVVATSRMSIARRFLTLFGGLLVVLGIGLAAMPFDVTLGAAPRSDFFGLSGSDSMPRLTLLIRDPNATRLLSGAKAPRLTCGMPLRMVFRSDQSDGGGWYNYAPNRGVATTSGSAPTIFCKPSAQRRVEVGLVLVLLGLVVIVASRRITRPAPT